MALKVHLTPDIFSLSQIISLTFEPFGRKKNWIHLNPLFSMPFQSRAQTVARPSFRKSGATVADDIYPGTKHNGASVSSLYLLEKEENKSNRLIYLGTKTCKSRFRISYFSSLESELSFDSKDSEINFDRARWIKVRRSYQDFKLLSWPRERKLNWKLHIFHLKRTFRVSWKHRHESFFRGLTLNFPKILGIFIAGSPGEMNSSEKFQIVFKKLMCCE